VAQPAQIGSKDLAQIHAPSEAVPFALLTPRFKSTKIKTLVERGADAVPAVP
jgi:hypothetical protein